MSFDPTPNPSQSWFKVDLSPGRLLTWQQPHSPRVTFIPKGRCIAGSALRANLTNTSEGAAASHRAGVEWESRESSHTQAAGTQWAKRQPGAEASIVLHAKHHRRLQAWPSEIAPVSYLSCNPAEPPPHPLDLQSNKDGDNSSQSCWKEDVGGKYKC